MNVHILSQVLLFLILFVCVWAFFFILYKDLAVDYFRQKMFDIRDRLFDEVSEGLVPFDHPSHLILRQTMNGFLRYGHKISLFEVLIAGLVMGSEHAKSCKSYKQALSEASKDLTTFQKERLGAYSARITELLLLQSFFGSPFFMIFLFLGLLTMRLPHSIYSLIRSKTFQLLKSLMEEPLDKIELTAMAYGTPK